MARMTTQEALRRMRGRPRYSGPDPGPTPTPPPPLPPEEERRQYEPPPPPLAESMGRGTAAAMQDAAALEGRARIWRNQAWQDVQDWAAGRAGEFGGGYQTEMPVESVPMVPSGLRVTDLPPEGMGVPPSLLPPSMGGAAGVYQAAPAAPPAAQFGAAGFARLVGPSAGAVPSTTPAPGVAAPRVAGMKPGVGEAVKKAEPTVIGHDVDVLTQEPPGAFKEDPSLHPARIQPADYVTPEAKAEAPALKGQAKAEGEGREGEEVAYPDTGEEYLDWERIDAAWRGSWEEFDEWALAFNNAHRSRADGWPAGFPPWVGSMKDPTENLLENIAALHWSQTFAAEHGHGPTDQDFIRAWYRDRFELGPYDVDTYPGQAFHHLGAGWGEFFADRWGREGWGEPGRPRGSGRGGRLPQPYVPTVGGYPPPPPATVKEGV